MKRKNLILLLSIILAVGIVIAVLGIKSHNDRIDDLSKNEEIIILHTNDSNGEIDNFSKIATIKKNYEKDGHFVLLFDSGDFIHGDPLVNKSKGKSAIEIMNLCGYDAVTIGNHEFDFGYDNLKELTKNADFSFLCSNIIYKNKKTFEEYKIFETPGKTKIGVFGLATPETATKAHPDKIKDVKFIGQENDKDLFDKAQKTVDILKEKNCDIIICLSHLGIDEESQGHRSTDLLNNVNGIDLMIDGHSYHTLKDIDKITKGTYKINNSFITSMGSKLEFLGKVTIKDKKLSNPDFIDLNKEDIKPNPKVDSKIRELHKEIENDYGKIIGKSEVYLDGDSNKVRVSETNFSNFLSDAVMWNVKENNIACDAVIVNGGDIRGSIEKGNIRKRDIIKALPYVNNLCEIKLKGDKLLEVLEASTFSTPASNGGFPVVSGIEFDLDTNIPYDAGDLYEGSTYKKPNSVKRVKITKINDNPFDINKTYTIITNDFLAVGGDTYYVFKEAEHNKTLDIQTDTAVITYIEKGLNGLISEERYKDVKKHINFK